MTRKQALNGYYILKKHLGHNFRISHVKNIVEQNVGGALTKKFVISEYDDYECLDCRVTLSTPLF